MLAESITTVLCGSLLDAISATMGTPCAGAPCSGLSECRRRRALDFIESNLSRPITLADIAAAAALSPHHFARAFRKAMGTTPMRYVWARRVAKAQGLLSDPGMPLAHVALACGFSSQSHFTTAFRACTGTTPAAWRRART